jgi:hypothetical protein
MVLGTPQQQADCEHENYISGLDPRHDSPEPPHSSGFGALYRAERPFQEL